MCNSNKFSIHAYIHLLKYYINLNSLIFLESCDKLLKNVKYKVLHQTQYIMMNKSLYGIVWICSSEHRRREEDRIGQYTNVGSMSRMSKWLRHKHSVREKKKTIVYLAYNLGHDEWRWYNKIERIKKHDI